MGFFMMKFILLMCGGGGHSSSLLTLLYYFRYFRESFSIIAKLFKVKAIYYSFFIIRSFSNQTIYKRTIYNFNLNDFFKLSQLTNITLIITFLYLYKPPYNLLIFISLIKTNNSTLKSKPFNQ
ncbi:hypothetical protein B6S12_06715, partial [Helicobacter valdiviensis]